MSLPYWIFTFPASYDIDLLGQKAHLGPAVHRIDIDHKFEKEAFLLIHTIRPVFVFAVCIVFLYLYKNTIQTTNINTVGWFVLAWECVPARLDQFRQVGTSGFTPPSLVSTIQYKNMKTKYKNA